MSETGMLECLYDLPMVFGTETEFGFACGKVLDEKKASFFTREFPEKIFNLILKIVVVKTGAFIRSPGLPWERGELNHLGLALIESLNEKAASGNRDFLDSYISEVGIFLPNGSRLYIDGYHLEYSVSECREPYEVVCQEKAMERILAEAIIEAQEICGLEIFLFKNNTDYKGNTYGCHENFLLRSEFFNRLYEENLWSRAWLSFITTGIIYTGGGKAGFEGGEPCSYQISQRADHIKTIFSDNSMHNRPLIHHRPEPLADPYKWGRFHVILDDSNMSEWPIYLKIGTKALVLNKLQFQYFEDSVGLRKRDSNYYGNLFLSDPIAALQAVSRDLTCKNPLTMNSNGASALEIQKNWLAMIKNFYSNPWHGYKAPWIFDVIEKWGQVLNWIEEDNPILDSVLDWRIKKQLIDCHVGRRSQGGQSTSEANIQSIDIHYHDISRKGLYNRLSNINRFAEGGDIEKARTDSSLKTRAWLRGQLIKRFLPHLIDVSWELLIFRLKFGNVEIKVRLDPDPLFSAPPEVYRIFEKAGSYEEFSKRFIFFYLNYRSIF